MKHFYSFVTLWVTMLFVALPTTILAENDKLPPLIVGDHEVDLTRSYDLITPDITGSVHFDAATQTLTFQDAPSEGKCIVASKISISNCWGKTRLPAYISKLKPLSKALDRWKPISTTKAHFI